MDLDKIELQLANFKLEVLQEIIHLLPHTGDPWKTLNFIMNRIFALVEMEGASLIVPDENGEKLIFKIVRGEKESELVGKVIDIDKGVAGRAFTTGEVALVQDTGKEEAFLKDIDNLTGYKTMSIMAVPIKSEDRVLGVLEGINLDVEEIENPAELSGLFESLADLIAVVLSNFEIREKLTEDSISVSRLLDISRTLNSTLDISDVLDAVINAAKNMIGCEAASLLLVDETGSNLVFFVASGEKKMELETQMFPIDKGLAGYTARTGKAIIANDAQNDERFDNSFDRETGFVTKSVMCVPMYHAGNIIGVLEAINKNDDAPFNNSDRELLKTLANDSGMAVRNSLLHKEKNELFHNAIKSLARAVNFKDEYEQGHSERVSFYAVQIGKCLRPDDWNMHEQLRVAGMVHDVGKIGIPDTILLKSGKISAAERMIVQTHSTMSHHIILPIKSLADCLDAVLHHHERFDGTGYPKQLKGNDIPLTARILAVADTFDAMTSDRPYRGKLSSAEACESVSKAAGTAFDPDIVEAFKFALEHELLEKPVSEIEEDSTDLL